MSVYTTNGCIGTPEQCGTESVWRDNIMARLIASALADPFARFNDGENFISGVYLTPREQFDASGIAFVTAAAPVVNFAARGTATALQQAARGVTAGAQNVANASKLAKQLGSQEGVAELLSGGGKAIAGAGTRVPLRDVGRLVSEYGGKPGDWAKITSTAEGHLQTHAYRNVVTGEVVELKSILP